MTKNTSGILLILATIFLSNPLMADQCDDANSKALEVASQAEKAMNQGDYQRAATLYDEAADQFDSIAKLTGCTNLNIPENAPINAQAARSAAESYRNYAQDRQLTETFNNAREILLNGKRFADEKKYAEAINEFERAANIWENLHRTFPHSETGSLAKEAAANARANIAQLEKITQGRKK